MQTYSLSCKELGNDTCDHVARGKTESEVKANMLEHASVAHAEDVNTEAREDALGRRIDDALAAKRPGGRDQARRAEGRDPEKIDNRANADPADLEEQARVSGYGMEDGSQGGEFLDDGTRNDDRDADGRRADRDRKAAPQKEGAGASRR